MHLRLAFLLCVAGTTKRSTLLLYPGSLAPRGPAAHGGAAPHPLYLGLPLDSPPASPGLGVRVLALLPLPHIPANRKPCKESRRGSDTFSCENARQDEYMDRSSCLLALPPAEETGPRWHRSGEDQSFPPS
ncbi:hypothetical protein llap_2186 [Limosa lapponica baueri]|uniref:Uncharacterized protein n=1 Tax=Limosa lapponica baueri TaxID=1758121 RepID=A0A2I0UNC1_LIMLA|nr:hypothetical protein llap_2186 [Limosa lapponica baueri]